VATLNDLLTARIPPHSLEAERAVLGAILLERESLPKAVELLQALDFYKEGHRKIFHAMLGLFERNEPVDLLTVSEELRRRTELEEVGGPAALAGLVEEAATAAHLLSYGGIVREKAVLRELIRISTEIIGQSYEAREPVDKLLDVHRFQAGSTDDAYSEFFQAKIKEGFLPVASAQEPLSGSEELEELDWNVLTTTYAKLMGKA